VVFDFNPLQPVRSWRERAAAQLSVRAEVVDARNIVPCFIASDKTEFAAYTFRPKIHRRLPEFLTDFPALPTSLRPYTGDRATNDWEAIAGYRAVSVEAPLPDWITPGETAAHVMLHEFTTTRLPGYAHKRNDPNEAAVSQLSPYLRWGNISAQRVALTVTQTRGIAATDREAFLEELIVRRELSDNYVYYTKDHATLAGAHPWAQATLHEHRHDPREYIYSLADLEAGKTHDPLWNAMQRQMVEEGKMHGWCRMYWAKKILEWTDTPEQAITFALTLNDRYELDGRDSNGVVGVMWSIAGVHDRAWTERPIFGKIRYMNFNGAKRKFDVAAYIDRYAPSDHTLFS
jgi:deoxyribodipyrimidine photo-lyase